MGDFRDTVMYRQLLGAARDVYGPNLYGGSKVIVHMAPDITLFWRPDSLGNEYQFERVRVDWGNLEVVHMACRVAKGDFCEAIADVAYTEVNAPPFSSLVFVTPGVQVTGHQASQFLEIIHSMQMAQTRVMAHHSPEPRAFPGVASLVVNPHSLDHPHFMR